ncbi:MAG: NAD(P)/FAD-dependent oxidoreductase [Rikenellaceae bacterium]
MKIAIVGGGAAGYFCAINIKELVGSDCDVTIFEASSRSMTKLAVTGGGRCNLTNSFEQISQLKMAYPRGEKLMKCAFRAFDYKQTFDWFEDHGIELVTQEDECVFPRSQDALEVVNFFADKAKEYNITVKHSHKVKLISAKNSGYELSFVDEKLSFQSFDIVVVTTGGQANLEGFEMLGDLGLTLSEVCPSLFSFNIPSDDITSLMGTVVDNVKLSLSGSKITSLGTLLITHWGMSGPAVLKLSSYGARVLSERDYKSKFFVNWCGDTKPEKILQTLNSALNENAQKLITSIKPFALPQRLWVALIEKSGISTSRRCAELGTKGINKLVNTLSNDEYEILGQTRFREEFVTCGGVSLSEIDLSTCESKKHANLFLAGEVLDIDAITGGFNLQAAWSTAYLITKAIEAKSANV